jgi:hypothetical protein
MGQTMQTWQNAKMLQRTYAFSCRTKLAKLLCLKFFGRRSRTNSGYFQMVKLQRSKQSTAGNATTQPIGSRIPIHGPQLKRQAKGRPFPIVAPRNNVISCRVTDHVEPGGSECTRSRQLNVERALRRRSNSRLTHEGGRESVVVFGSHRISRGIALARGRRENVTPRQELYL